MARFQSSGTAKDLTTSQHPPKPEPLPHGLSAVVSALTGVRYGQVRCQIHDGVIVQIDRTTRQRIDRAGQLLAGSDPRRGAR